MRNALLALSLVSAASLTLCVGITRHSRATVTTETTTVDYTCSGGSTYSVPFPFLNDAHLAVTKFTGACGSTTSSSLILGTDYTVARSGAESGTVTLTAACTAGYCLRITRATPKIQETNFRGQGSFSADSHEDAVDKLTMISQELEQAAGSVDLTTHKAADDHTGYALLAGRSGGQTLYGGTDAGDDVTIISTDNGTLGTVALGAQLYCDGVNDRVGINDSTPSYDLDVTGDIRATDDLFVGGEIYGAGASETDLYIYSNASKDGNIYLGADCYFDEEQQILFCPFIAGGPDAEDDLWLQPGSGGDVVLGSTTYFQLTNVVAGSGAIDIGTNVNTTTITNDIKVDRVAEFEVLDFDQNDHTIASSGDANPAADTLTPTYNTSDGQSLFLITCNDPDTCDVTLGETSIYSGQVLIIVNVDTNTVDLADSAGVSEIAGAFAMGQWDSIQLVYVTDRWVEMNRSNN